MCRQATVLSALPTLVLRREAGTCIGHSTILFSHTGVYEQQVNRSPLAIVSDRQQALLGSASSKWPTFRAALRAGSDRGIHSRRNDWSQQRNIARLEREIELLREYRTRLVADVVTGKLDVREAAARLPEVDDAPAVESELAEMEDAGDELSEVDV